MTRQEREHAQQPADPRVGVALLLLRPLPQQVGEGAVARAAEPVRVAGRVEPARHGPPGPPGGARVEAVGVLRQVQRTPGSRVGHARRGVRRRA